MGKEKISDDRFDQSGSGDSMKFEQSEREVYKQSDSKTVEIVYKLNKKKELRIGRIEYVFYGRESKTVPASVITHPDFLGQEKYFVIKEKK